MFSSNSLSGQSLQFSRVLRVNNTQDTVPQNKTWKVEQFWQSDTQSSLNSQAGSCTVPGYHHPFYIDGERYWVFRHSENFTSLIAGNEFPLWLEAGTTLRTECPDDFLSILEFTIVP